MATSFAAGFQSAADRHRSQTGILADVTERTVHPSNLQRACPPLENYRHPNPTAPGAKPSISAENRHFCVIAS